MRRGARGVGGRFRRPTRRWLAAALGGAWLALVWPLVAVAHPLGNFTINHYAELHVRAEAIVITYVLDMAEIPAFQAIQQMDANGNGRPDADEVQHYHPAVCNALRPQLVLQLDQRPLLLTLEGSAVEFRPGVGGLSTLRLTCTMQASLARGGMPAQVTFADQTYAERLGWRELVVIAEGVALHGSFATHSVSNQLTSYPNDLLDSPLDQRQVTFELRSAAEPARDRGQPMPVNRARSLLPGRREDAFTALITLQTLSLPTVLAALAIAVTWGGMHALSPGHGKTIVAAYLVGARGTWQHALLLGVTTTVTHTAGVFVLGGITLLASHWLVPEQVYPWLSLSAGLLVVTIGLQLLAVRLRSVRWLGQGTPDAIHGPEHPTHAHHEHVPHVHEHPHPHPHPHPAAHPHPHLPPGAEGSAATWRSLLALGISGGILPCPSALVVLLSAVALGRIGFGLVLVVAFSLGLAAVLTAIGLLFVYAGRWFGRLPVQGRVLHWLPVASALLITLAGVGITLQALRG